MNSKDKKYKKIFNLVKDVIVNNDPAGLIDGGAPNDEYDTVINRIVSMLKNCKSEAEIKELIKVEFSGIGSIVNEHNCNNVAQEIYKKIRT
jgi:hypothetical protein